MGRGEGYRCGISIIWNTHVKEGQRRDRGRRRKIERHDLNTASGTERDDVDRERGGTERERKREGERERERGGEEEAIPGGMW